jgi:hypothetical protein
MKTKVKVIVTSIAVAVSFAIYQSIIGFVWESERTGLSLIITSLHMACVYFMYWFCYSMGWRWIARSVAVVMIVAIIALNFITRNDPVITVTTGRTLSLFFRVGYYMLMAFVAYHQAEPMHEEKKFVHFGE